MEEYVGNLSHALLLAHETARKKLRATQKRMKRDYDVKVYRREFQEGDRVYLLNTAVVKGIQGQEAESTPEGACGNREEILPLPFSVSLDVVFI